MANSQSFAHETSTNFVLTESLFKAFNSSSNESFSFINSSIPKTNKESFFLVFPCTVEPHSTDIHLIWAPIYNGQFCLSQLKAHIFSLKILCQIQATDTFRVVRHKFSHINSYQPRFMDTFYLCTVYD